MTEATETTAELSKTVAKELGRAVVVASVQTAAEMTAAVLLMAAAGWTINKVQARKAKKNTPAPAES